MTTPQDQSSYIEMGNNNTTTNNEKPLHESDIEKMNNTYPTFTPYEVERLKAMLRYGGGGDEGTISSVATDFPGYGESTHSWAVFADNPNKRISKLDRLVGLSIITFQLFTYVMFVQEALIDYKSGLVPVLINHGECMEANYNPQENLVCEALFTDDLDAFVAFFMLGIFLAGDFIQAFKVVRMAPFGPPLIFASLAAIEIICAYFAACIAISYNLYIGEVTDAIEVGVGLLFIRELSQRAYAGIRSGKEKQHKIYFSVVAVLVVIGMFMDPLSERLFATKGEYGRD